MASRFNLDLDLDGSPGAALYNTSTGNYLRLEAEEAAAYRRVLLGTSDAEDDLERLCRGGFVVDAEVDELAAVRQAFDFITANPTDPHLTIAPTMDCNFGCAYCFESHRPGVMDPAVRGGLVDFVAHLAGRLDRAPALTVTWFGGEPTLALPVIRELDEGFRRLVGEGALRERRADLITNGFSVGARHIGLLTELGIRQIQITLDGPPSVHDQRRTLKRSGGATFERILANIDELAAWFAVVVRINVDHANANAVPELLDVLEAAGVMDRVVVDPARVEALSEGSRPEHLMSTAEFAAWRQELHEHATRRGWELSNPLPGPSLHGVCQVDGLNSFVIDTSGHLFKCWAELGSSAPPVGHVVDPSTWPTGKVGPLATRDPFDHPACSECALLPTCLGGCPKAAAVGEQDGTAECPPFRHRYAEVIKSALGDRDTVLEIDMAPSSR